MRRCDSCGVTFSGDLPRCPLCGRPLAGDPVPAAFPVNEVHRTSKLARRLLAAATLTCISAAIIGGIALRAPVPGIIAICAAFAITYLFLRNIMVHTPDFLRIVERYFLLLLGVAALWFAGTGSLTVATYVIPLISTSAILFNTVLLAAYRSAFVSGYAKYLLYNLVLGLAPLVFVFLGLATWPVPACINAAAAVILGILLAALARKQSAEEARKLFSA